jgi:hypothetical protein
VGRVGSNYQPVVEKVFDSNHGRIRQLAFIHNAIATFPEHIALAEV